MNASSLSGTTRSLVRRLRPRPGVVVVVDGRSNGNQHQYDLVGSAARPAAGAAGRRRTIATTTTMTSFFSKIQGDATTTVNNTRRTVFPSLADGIQRRAAHQTTISKNNWFKMKDKDRIEKCLYVQTILPKGDMNDDTIEFCLSAVAGLSKKHNIREQDAQFAESMLERLYEETRTGNPSIRPLTATPYIQVLRAWARSESPHALEKCWAICERMQSRHQEQPLVQPSPLQQHVYHALLYVCGRTTHPDARHIADEWIRTFEASAHQKGEHLPVELYNAVILVHATRAADEYGAAATAEDWLIYLSKLYTEGGPAPNTDSFNRVLRAWSQSPETHAVRRSKEILDLMLQLKQDHDSVAPDPTTFATILLACANHRQPEQATEFWHKTLDYFRDKPQETVELSDCLKPTSMAWSKSVLPEAANRIRELLNDSLQPEEEDAMQHITFAMEVLESTFKHLLYCLVGNGDIQQAEKELRDYWHSQDSRKRHIASPQILHFVCQAYNRSDLADKATRVAQLLLDAVELSRTQKRIQSPETRTFNLALDMTLRNPETKPFALILFDEAQLADRANLYTHALILNSFCKEKTKESALQAFDVAKRLHTLHIQGLIQMKRENFGLYTAVCLALANVQDREAADKCLELFEMIKSSQRWRVPTSMYNSVIFSLRVQGEKGRRKAFDLFQEILRIESYPSEIVSLDSFICLTVLKVLRSEGDIQSVADSLAVISEMLRLYGQGREKLCPSQACLDACLVNVLTCGDAKMLETGRRLVKALHRLFEAGQLKELPSEKVLQVLNARK